MRFLVHQLLEEAARTHPAGVVECTVVAVADDMVANRLIAYLTLREGVTIEVVSALCGDRLPRYMVPGSIKHGGVASQDLNRQDRPPITTEIDVAAVGRSSSWSG